MSEDIASFVHLAALNHGPLSEELGNGTAQRLRPVDDEQHRALGRQPPLDQVSEQGAGDGRVLRGRVRAILRSGAFAEARISRSVRWLLQLTG